MSKQFIARKGIISLSGSTMESYLNVSGDTTAKRFITSGGTSTQFVKGDGTLDSNTYLTGFTDTNDYVTGATFNTSDGVLTLARLSGGTVTTNLDNRYSLTGHTHDASDIISGVIDYNRINGVYVVDTRTDNQPPDYYDNIAIFEMKRRINVDYPVGGGHREYGTMLTTSPWYNDGGGTRNQLYFTGQLDVGADKPRILTRQGDEANGWGPWYELITTYNINDNIPIHTGQVTGSTALTIVDNVITLSMLTATGTKNSSTYLRGDNTWSVITNTNDYVTGATFNTSNGNLTLARLSGGTVVVDLDGKYANDNDVVHITGNEVIDGTKDILRPIVKNSNDIALIKQSSNYGGSNLAQKTFMQKVVDYSYWGNITGALYFKFPIPTTTSGNKIFELRLQNVNVDSDTEQLRINLYSVGTYRYAFIGRSIGIFQATTNNIRFGKDATHWYIILKDVDFEWNFPSLIVDDVILPRNQSEWKTGWSAGILTDLSGITLSEFTIVRDEDKFVSSTTNIIAGVGLEGGGVLNQDRTLSISATTLSDIANGVIGYTYSQIGHLPLSGGTMGNTNLVNNLNADLLDSQHGSYYLDYNNFTNTPTINTYSGSTSIILTGVTFQRAALTGDVTAPQNSNTTTIATNAVTYAKIQNMTTARMLGRSTAGSGNIEEISIGSGLNLISGVLSADTSSLVPNTRTLTAGNGLTGGGNLTVDRTFTLGTPTSVTLASTNSVASTSHTHAFTPGGSSSQYIRGDGALATLPSTFPVGWTISNNWGTFAENITFNKDNYLPTLPISTHDGLWYLKSTDVLRHEHYVHETSMEGVVSELRATGNMYTQCPVHKTTVSSTTSETELVTATSGSVILTPYDMHTNRHYVGRARFKMTLAAGSNGGTFRLSLDGAGTQATITQVFTSPAIGANTTHTCEFNYELTFSGNTVWVSGFIICRNTAGTTFRMYQFGSELFAYGVTTTSDKTFKLSYQPFQTSDSLVCYSSYLNLNATGFVYDDRYIPPGDIGDIGG